MNFTTLIILIFTAILAIGSVSKGLKLTDVLKIVQTLVMHGKKLSKSAHFIIVILQTDIIAKNTYLILFYRLDCQSNL